MKHLYVPYSGAQPATICVKGHIFIILARDADSLFADMGSIGADRLEEISYPSAADEDESLEALAREINGAIVIAPKNVKVADILVNLESELPWIH